jgi:hypothetical protein
MVSWSGPQSIGICDLIGNQALHAGLEAPLLPPCTH